MLSLAQFPWRILSVQALFGSVVIGSLVTIIPDSKVFSTRYGVLRFRIIFVIIVSVVMGYTGLGKLKPDFIPITDFDVTAQRLQWYESFSGNIGTTIRYEYLPHWTYPRPYTSDILLQREPLPRFFTGSGTGKQLSTGVTSQVWQFVIDENQTEVAVPILYWPGWRAMIDGTVHEVYPVEGIGYIGLNLDEGNHIVEFRLGRTPVRLWAEVISLFSVGIVLILWRPTLPRWNMMQWGFFVAGLLSIFTFNRILISLPDFPPIGVLNADFGQHAYFYTAYEGPILWSELQ